MMYIIIILGYLRGIKMNKRQIKKYKKRGYRYHYKDFKKEYYFTCKMMDWNKKEKQNLNNYIVVKEVLKSIKPLTCKYKFEPELVQSYNPDFAGYFNYFKYGCPHLNKSYDSKIILKEGEFING